MEQFQIYKKGAEVALQHSAVPLTRFPLMLIPCILEYTGPGEFLFQYPIILPFHTVHGVLKARILSGLPFPSPVDHILSDLSPMTRPSWVAAQAWLSFIELDKAVVLV